MKNWMAKMTDIETLDTEDAGKLKDLISRLGRISKQFSSFSDSRIKEFLVLAKHNDNKCENTNDDELLKKDFVEAKMQVDRWGACTTDWVFHTSKKERIAKLFPLEEKEPNPQVGIFNTEEMWPCRAWGANIHFTECLEPTMALGIAFDFSLSSLQENDSENIANSVVAFEVK